MQTFILLFLFTTCHALLGSIGRKQSVGAMGKLTCNGRPAQGIKVKLYDEEIIADRKLDQDRTDESGKFMLSGTAREISPIDPHLNIYHKCNYGGPCHKKITIKIPPKYVNGGDEVERYFDLGTLELATMSKKQSTDCIN
ncbi:Transthyretin-like family protein [Ancylostoma ceylanicum]|uniref:Transthyretin-like family protein n=1 Tax=Ancylostoma ceylanicum TaxID=53326 RepID=A0A0D6LHE6_9BILA|nr:Transthyretin-like family protein [Ancylostoma ceylanicum]